MKRVSISIVLASCATIGTAFAQPSGARHARPTGVTARSGDGAPTVLPNEPLVAALPYDGSSMVGARAQDFESPFDGYDIFVIEDIGLDQDATLGTFQCAGFGNSNPFGTQDVRVRVFEDNGTGLPGQDGYTGRLMMESVPDAGFYDGAVYTTDFGGRCLSEGSYFLVWAALLDFGCCGASYMFVQDGNPTVGGGEANNAWYWNPGGAFGAGTHFEVLDDPPLGEQTGVNYLLFGEPADCGGGCANPDCPADLDLDGDADSDDFFLYLDRFAGGDPCADIDADGDADSDDFFAYLDQFAQGC